jgi:hypothetical protein
MLRDTYDSFRVVQLHASCKAALCEQAKLRDDELVKLAGGSAWGTWKPRWSHSPPWDTAASFPKVTVAKKTINTLLLEDCQFHTSS